MGRAWEAIAKMPYFLDDTSYNPYLLEQGMTSSSSVVYLLGRPAIGLLWGHSIIEGMFGFAAIALWDRKAWGRLEEIQKVVEAVMRVKNLHHLTATIAEPNRGALKLARRLGFVETGRIKEGLRYREKWTNVVLLIKYREEILG